MAWLRLSLKLHEVIKLPQRLQWHTADDPPALGCVRVRQGEEADGREGIASRIVRNSNNTIVKRAIGSDVRQLTALQRVSTAAVDNSRLESAHDVMLPARHYGTLSWSWPWMSVGRLRDTALVRCDVCVNGGGVLADVCGASDDWWF